jgi:hypothetical protein
MFWGLLLIGIGAGILGVVALAELADDTVTKGDGTALVDAEKVGHLGGRAVLEHQLEGLLLARGEVAGEGADKVALLAGQGIGIGIGVDGGMEEGGGEELAERDKLEGVLPACQMGEEAATAPVDPKGLLEGGGGGSEGGKMKPEVDVALLHEVGTEVGVAFGTSEAEALDEARMTKDEIVESFIVGVGHD